jgi:hypothetical protein
VGSEISFYYNCNNKKILCRLKVNRLKKEENCNKWEIGYSPLEGPFEHTENFWTLIRLSDNETLVGNTSKYSDHIDPEMIKKLTEEKVNSFLAIEKIIENKNNKKEINNSNFNSNNISFNSFEENDGSVIIKTDDNSIKKEYSNSVSIFKDLELAAEKNNSYKSFIQLHNTLKFKKNKEENATESYLLALGLNGNNNNIEKRNLINSNQIIEEEKSDILNSECEFSSKKKFLKKKFK